MKEKYNNMGLSADSTFFGAQNGTRCNNLMNMKIVSLITWKK